MTRAGFSRQRFRRFLADYKARRIEDGGDGVRPPADAEASGDDAAAPTPKRLFTGRRREYLRDFVKWLKPHRHALAGLFALALVAAGLQMVEPLFMRFIIDRVLLDTTLDGAARLTRLHLAGGLFVFVIVVSNLTGVVKDYRQHLLNVRVMLSLRRALFQRLLHLPLSRLSDMKTGGILSRLTGDVDTTTGLLQSAIVSPALSVVRLAIAVIVLFTLNWRLALTALAIIPGITVMSLVFSRRIRPIYRSLRKDVEHIDGRVGETFSGIRVVRAFRGEARELLDYLLGHLKIQTKRF
jgi:ATP-binding cassette subfamily B protein/subfamily B ATP-binding cassette protein MsbA